MICSTCGGLVTWRGPWSNMTHTECAHCGAINNQIGEPSDPDDEIDGDAAIVVENGL